MLETKVKGQEIQYDSDCVPSAINKKMEGLTDDGKEALMKETGQMCKELWSKIEDLRDMITDIKRGRRVRFQD